MRAIKTLLFSVCILTFTSNGFAASWSVSSAPFNASVAKAAKTTNDSGDALYMWRGAQAGQFFAELQLAQGKNLSNKTPGYQIDQGMIVKLNRIPVEPFKSKEGWLRITDRSATWQVYDGENNTVNKDEAFYNWFVGDRIRFIYFEANGTERTTEFSLTGSSSSFAKAAGVKAVGVSTE